MTPGKKVFFLSDFYLGAPGFNESLQREKKIVAFFDTIKAEAQTIVIVGDMFDFWFEYKNIIPKGYVRLLGKLAELTDKGTEILFFVGNHDMWMRNYFQQELNIPVFFEPKTFEWNGKKFYVAHGDGLGPGDHKYKFMKSVFRNKICQSLFGLIHPSVSISLANYFSRKSRNKTGKTDEFFLGEDKEWLIIHSRQVLAKDNVDFFIYGHRHLPLTIRLTDLSTYINLGDWVKYFTYAEFDGQNTVLKEFTNP